LQTDSLKFHRKRYKPYPFHKLLRAESLAPHHAIGTAWHSTCGSTPNDNLLHVSSTTPRLSGVDVLIAYLRPHHKEYEDCSAPGGSTPTHSRIDDTNVGQKRHELGVTCVVIWSRNRAAVSTLCGSSTPREVRGLLHAWPQHSYSLPHRRRGHRPETARAGSHLRGNTEPQQDRSRSLVQLEHSTRSTRTSPRSAAALLLTPTPTTRTSAGDGTSWESPVWQSEAATRPGS